MLTTDPTTGIAYGYSNENQLISAPSTTISYDGLMRLYQVTGATSAQFAYDGTNMIAEYQGASVKKRYVFGPGTDEPIVQYDAAGNRSWMTADERGSIVAMSNDAGTATAIDTYDEYGKPGATNLGRFQYTGQMWLPEAALYHDKARIYVPQLGVFAQPDPIGQAGGPNLYAYVRGDPVNLVDPLGALDCALEANWRSGNCADEAVADQVKQLNQERGATAGQIALLTKAYLDLFHERTDLAGFVYQLASSGQFGGGGAGASWQSYQEIVDAMRKASTLSTSKGTSSEVTTYKSPGTAQSFFDSLTTGLQIIGQDNGALLANVPTLGYVTLYSSSPLSGGVPTVMIRYSNGLIDKFRFSGGH